MGVGKWAPRFRETSDDPLILQSTFPFPLLDIPERLIEAASFDERLRQETIAVESVLSLNHQIRQDSESLSAFSRLELVSDHEQEDAAAKIGGQAPDDRVEISIFGNTRAADGEHRILPLLRALYFIADRVIVQGLDTKTEPSEQSTHAVAELGARQRDEGRTH